MVSPTPDSHISIPFWKMHGAGNDFILVDDRNGIFPATGTAECIRRMCHRRRGIGADGLVLIQPAANADFRMRFYNSDGGEADMCGNASRCVARLAYEENMAGVHMAFETGAGLMKAECILPLVRLRMLKPIDERIGLSILWNNKKMPVHFVNTGVPHAVIFVEDIRSLDVPKFGAFVRHHPLFAPDGANVNFVQRMSPDTIHIRTFERGVEAETLACGTGITAAAYIGKLLGSLRFPAKIITIGNDVLTVDENPFTLTGPAEHVFRGVYDYRQN